MKDKALPKIIHGQLYKSALWATIVVFSVATLIAVFAILLDGFSSFTFRMLFVMWQVFWFGFMAIIFARFYERNTFAVARCIAVVAVACCALLLMIGVYQAIFPVEYHYEYYGYGQRYVRSDLDIVVSKIQMILSCFVYVGIFIEWHLMVKSNVQAVILARNITAAVMMTAMLVLDAMIIADFDDMGGIMMRLIVVMLILAVTGMVVTRILASIYSKDNRPTEPTQVTQEEEAGSAGVQPVVAASEERVNGNSSDTRVRFIEQMKEITGRSEGECIAIVNVFENGHLLGRQKKDELVKGLMDNLAMSEEEADRIYDEYIGIMMSEFLKR